MSNETTTLDLPIEYKTKHLLVRASIANFLNHNATRKNPNAKILESYLSQCPQFVQDLKKHLVEHPEDAE